MTNSSLLSGVKSSPVRSFRWRSLASGLGILSLPPTRSIRWRSLASGLALSLVAAGCGCSSSSESSDPVAVAEAASAAFAGGDYAGALERSQACLALTPDNVDVLILQGRAALATGDFALAGEAAAKAAALHPGDVAVLQLTAQAAFQNHDFESATKAYTRLAFDESLPPEIRALGYVGRGIVGLARVGTGSAPEDCRDVSRLDFLRALALDPRNKPARYHLGHLYRNAFHFKQAALEQFSAYVALMKQTADPHVAKAQAEVDSLTREIETEKARRPGADKRKPEACAEAMRKADAARQKKQLKTAANLYGEALRHDPLSFEAADRLAQCTLELDGRTRAGQERAYALYCQAASLRTYVKTMIAAGDLAMKLGKWASAATHYSRAMAAKPTDLTAIDGLIRALQKCGNRKSAAIYQRYRDAIPVRK